MMLRYLSLLFFFVRLFAFDVFSHLSRLGATKALIVIDGDNVRGKMAFKMSKELLLENINKLVVDTLPTLKNRVLVVFDHGEVAGEGFIAYPQANIIVTFSGPVDSGDDVVVNTLSWLGDQYLLMQDLSVCVVTEDNELKKRCKKSIQEAQDKSLSFLSGKNFAEYLLEREAEQKKKEEGEEEVASSSSPSGEQEEAIRKLKKKRERLCKEVELCKFLRENKSMLANAPRKNRPQILRRITELEIKISRLNIDDEEEQEQVGLGVVERGAKLIALTNKLGYRDDTENTWERIVNAEHLRCELAQASTRSSTYFSLLSQHLQPSCSSLSSSGK